MADTFDNSAPGASYPPGYTPDDPGYLASLEADLQMVPDLEADFSACIAPARPRVSFEYDEASKPDDLPQGPIPPERPAKLPLFSLPELGAPYPVDALPPLLKDAVEAISDMTQCDPAIAAGSVLGAASLAVQAHADVITPHGQTVATSLYLVTLAESGDRKSAADKLAMAAVREAEAAGQEARRAGWGDYMRAKDAWAEAKAFAIKKNKGDRRAIEAALKAVGDEPRPPLDPSIVVSEPTISGLVKLFHAGRPALGLFSDEGGMMLGGHAMRDDSRTNTLGSLNHLWQGEPMKWTRSGDGNSLLQGRRLALHLMIQPGIAPKLLGDAEAISTGLVARLLVAAPPSRPGERPFRMPKPESTEAVARFKERLGALLQGWPHHPEDPQQLEPRRLKMTEHARMAWIAFHDACQARLRKGGAWEAIRAWGEKAPEQAARLAGVLAVTDNPKADAIESLSMAQAIRLVEHYGAEVARLAGQPMLDAKTLRAADLLDWIKRKGWHRFPLQWAYQGGPKPIRTAAAAREACELLAYHGELTPLPYGLVVDGKRCKDAYQVMPD